MLIDWKIWGPERVGKSRKKHKRQDRIRNRGLITFSGRVFREKY